MLNWLDSSREADDREEETVHIKVLKHALNWMAIDAEGDTGHTQIQAAADYVVCSQSVSIGRSHLAGHSTCTAKQNILTSAASLFISNTLKQLK